MESDNNICGNCNQRYTMWRKCNGIESCDRCQDVRVRTCDVYYKEPSFEEHLADAKHPQGQWVTSKSHKARLMREQGVRESGDRQHGSRF